MHVLIVGCGYLGGRAAKLWLDAGCRVSALTRSKRRAEQFRDRGIEPLFGDVMDEASLAVLPAADVMVYAVGYGRSSQGEAPSSAVQRRAESSEAGSMDRRSSNVEEGYSKRDLALRGLANVLQRTSGRVSRVVYVSSVSVYGQSDGSWVDEDSPCCPATEGGRLCLAAEEAFRAFLSESQATAGCVLRLAGIYGPGRLIARAEQLRAGRPLSGEPEAWLNLIHVEDAARCLVACGSASRLASTYVVADDRPVRRIEFYSRAAELVDAPPPAFAPHAEAPQRTNRLNKRCRNARMRAALLPELIHPDFSTGLAASIESDA